MNKGTVMYFAGVVLEFTRLHLDGPLANSKGAYHRIARRWLDRWEPRLLEEIDSIELRDYFVELVRKEVPSSEIQHDGGFLKLLFD